MFEMLSYFGGFIASGFKFVLRNAIFYNLLYVSMLVAVPHSVYMHLKYKDQKEDNYWKMILSNLLFILFLPIHVLIEVIRVFIYSIKDIVFALIVLAVAPVLIFLIIYFIPEVGSSLKDVIAGDFNVIWFTLSSIIFLIVGLIVSLLGCLGVLLVWAICASGISGLAAMINLVANPSTKLIFSLYAKSFGTEASDYEEYLLKRKKKKENKWYYKWFELSSDNEYNYSNNHSNHENYNKDDYEYNTKREGANKEFKERFETYCLILGLSYQCDIDDVKKAYRKLAKEYHPDINKSADASSKFQKIKDAFDFLSKAHIDEYKEMFGKR